MKKAKEAGKTEKAIFAMGCFWGPQLLFDKLPGVLKTRVGYMGGKEDKKEYSYREVCSDATGHAEVVEIEFNSEKIAYGKLLDFFWENHDSTQMNRQGPDFGSQYRSAIFYSDDSQKKLAEKSKEELQKRLKNKITTKIVKAGKFYEAEEYHQKYLEKKGLESCHI